MAKMRVVMYLRGEDDGELDDAEKRCNEHAERFGWQVLDVTRHKAGMAADLNQLVLKVSKLRAQIIVTDTLDMLSPDAVVRDGFMEAIERQQCIVHPVNMRLAVQLRHRAAMSAVWRLIRGRRIGGRPCWTGSGCGRCGASVGCLRNNWLTWLG